MNYARLKLVAGLTAIVTALSGCMGSGFATSYDAPIAASVARGWHVVDVRVDVPQSLTVSEEKSLVPDADIVWREDPLGDRHPQVAAIMRKAIAKGASGLHGPRAVRIEARMATFHAMTFEAEQLNISAGVHNILMSIQVVDAHSGKVLFGPTTMEASFPALTGVEMIAARARGETQKSQIIEHVAQTIAGWLSIGPDNRTAFERAGG